LHHPGLLRTMAASVFSGCSPAVAAYVHEYVPTHEVHMVMELMEGSVVTAFKGRDIQQLGNLLMAASVAEQVWLERENPASTNTEELVKLLDSLDAPWPSPLPCRSLGP